jgi:hypothetical protein
MITKFYIHKIKFSKKGKYLWHQQHAVDHKIKRHIKQSTISDGGGTFAYN